MHEPKKEPLRKAIGLATGAFTDDPERPTGDGVLALIGLGLEEDPETYEIDVITGFLTLVTILLIRIENLGGPVGQTTLQEIAAKYTA